MLHLCSDRVNAEELAFRLSVYQTSSPSYLLMASIDSCVQLLADRKEALFPQWAQAIRSFYDALQLKHLQLPLQNCPDADPSKLLISTAGTHLTGPALAQRLREEHHIEVEMSTADTVLCMTGLGDTEEVLLTLAGALNAIDRTLTLGEAVAPAPLPLPKQAMAMHAAAKQETITVPLQDSEGAVAGDFLWAYPPGIPLVVPGEHITAELIAYISMAESRGVDISGPKHTEKHSVCILKSSLKNC